MSRRRLLVLTLVAGGLVLAPARAAVSCTCKALPLGNPVELAGTHDPQLDTAFIGTVERAGARPVFAVDVTLAGKPGRQPTVVPGSGDCAFGFEAGRQYLVEGHRNADGRIATSRCSFTQPYGDTAEAVARAQEADRGAPAPASSRSPVPAIIVFAILAVGAGLILRFTLRGDRTKPEPTSEIPGPEGPGGGP